MRNTPLFTLNNFEGSLELLLYLIQKEEVDVADVTIQELTKQLIKILEKSGVETNAELMGLAATLLLIKSQKLLPYEKGELEECVEDPRVEIIEKLIEYCRFRDAASTLSTREEEQQSFFPRAAPLFKKEMTTGLEEVSLDDLKQIMFQMVQKAEKKPQQIQDEQWQIAPKILWLQDRISRLKKIPFEEVFFEGKCREELIVSFLALLEMMKLQELKVVRENNFLYIIDPYEYKSD